MNRGWLLKFIIVIMVLGLIVGALVYRRIDSRASNMASEIVSRRRIEKLQKEAIK